MGYKHLTNVKSVGESITESFFGWRERRGAKSGLLNRNSICFQKEKVKPCFMKLN